MIRRLRQPIWIIPLALAGLVALVGWWGQAHLRRTIEGELRADLAATLAANTTALDIWMTDQTKLAALLAEEPGLRTIMLEALEKSPQSPVGRPGRSDSREVEEFNNYLRQRLVRISYEAALLVNSNFVVAANSGPGRMRLTGTMVSEAQTNKFGELFASGQPVIITPFKPEPPPGMRFPPGGRRNGKGPQGAPFGAPPPPFDSPDTNQPPPGGRPPFPESARGRRGDLTLMQVAAPVRDATNVVRGALALIINPDREFSRILSVARSGESGETYAFDQHGLLISRSRFDDQLRQMGLLDATNASSALNLRLQDPGGDLSKGFKPTGELSTRALTRMVTNAVAGGRGVDVSASRDYRGIPVVGAWCWLPQHGFGVVTQIDAAEAFQTLHLLQLVFVVLFLLLVLSACIMVLFSYRDLVWRQRLSAAELKLKQLGQYTLEEKIGEGGMGVVYRAHHALMRRDTAVKLLLPEKADRASVERFEREVCLTCQLTHPNTIQIYDYGHTPEGIFYYVMELLQGMNLRDLVERFGPVPESRAIHLLAQVCESLAEAHTLGLVHRDIKPANVYLCDRGGVPDCVKVLDFGLVRLQGDTKGDKHHVTGEQEMVGTPWFMAPEAIKNSARCDPRSDIYAVGALGYYLLTAQFVFDAASVVEIYGKQLTESPQPLNERAANRVSDELEQVILRCLAKDPDLRPQTVTELRALLLNCPHALEWGLELRSGWWARYRSQSSTASPETGPTNPRAMETTVRIDLASRMG